eukprot:scaffold2835_cov280-Chaetoceros_neogracile.AAC.3
MSRTTTGPENDPEDREASEEENEEDNDDRAPTLAMMHQGSVFEIFEAISNHNQSFGTAALGWAGNDW